MTTSTAQKKAWRDANRERVNARTRELYRMNIEKHRERERNRRPRKLEQNRAYQLKTLYGITIEQHAEMLTRQGGKCAVCRSDRPSANRNWCVDHDHKTGVIRGLLCHHCNVMVGYARDNPEILLAGARYLGGNDA